MKTNFTGRYNTSDVISSEHESSLKEREQKAIITIAGQGFDKRIVLPQHSKHTEGGSLGAVIEGGALASADNFTQDPWITAFADFIKAIVL